MRTEETTKFLEAYRNKPARELVQQMMVLHYSEAILAHHPDRGHLDPQETLSRCENLVNQTFKRLNAASHNPSKLFPVLHQLSRLHQPQDAIWWKDFDLAYENYKHHNKLKIRYQQLKPHLWGNSLADIGCGGGDLVHYLKKNHYDFKICAGIDLMDWRTPALKDQIDFQQLDFSQPHQTSPTQYDTVTCIAVLHHVGNDDQSRSIFLQNIKSALTVAGRLIIEEDVLLPQEEIIRNEDYKRQIEHCKQHQALFPDFLAMDQGDQKDVLILIDFLANALATGVPQMPFPAGFLSLNQWKALLRKNGFSIKDVVIKGFSRGLFNRSSHVFFILQKAA
ncbi:MAG: class I SAM-dependent methyltransferase [Candidatus Cyclobacteriaceae bacterium M3_2C_046]